MVEPPVDASQAVGVRTVSAGLRSGLSGFGKRADSSQGATVRRRSASSDGFPSHKRHSTCSYIRFRNLRGCGQADRVATTFSPAARGASAGPIGIKRGARRGGKATLRKGWRIAALRLGVRKRRTGRERGVGQSKSKAHSGPVNLTDLVLTRRRRPASPALPRHPQKKRRSSPTAR
jgi:hypothetical protein